MYNSYAYFDILIISIFLIIWRKIMEKDLTYKKSGSGYLKISEDVIGVIAGIAASEVKGVSDLIPQTNGGITQIFAGKNKVAKSIKGVKVSLGEETVIDMVISIEYGCKIPKVVEEVQKNVMNNVETITGLKVNQVNVTVNNIYVKEEENA